jgi:hypothetical protein
MQTLKNWLDDFWKVLFKPTQETFQEIESHAKGRFGNSVAVSAISSFLLMLAAYVHYPYLDVSIVYNLVSTLLLYPLLIIVLAFICNFFFRKLFRRRKNHHETFLYFYTLLFEWYVVVHLVFVFTLPPNWSEWVVLGGLLILGVVGTHHITKLKIWQSSVLLISSMLIGGFLYILVVAMLFSMIGVVPRML